MWLRCLHLFWTMHRTFDVHRYDTCKSLKLGFFMTYIQIGCVYFVVCSFLFFSLFCCSCLRLTTAAVTTQRRVVRFRANTFVWHSVLTFSMFSIKVDIRCTNSYISALASHLPLETYCLLAGVHRPAHVSHVIWWIVAFFCWLLGNMLLRTQS